ncbi:MAG: glycosyltransferase family 39 protein [Bacteroidota bacterium]|nr:glycosyltransferase family 39 protein [Bacteroidota bacterium]
MSKFKSIKEIIFILTVLLIAGVPLTHKLGYLTIRHWDEARLACNVYEMLENDHYWVVHFEGKPDMWNTKPPLFLWLQTIVVSIFGFNEKSLRILSALSGIIICLLVSLLTKRITKNYFASIISCLILVTSPLFINTHTCRTGDYDAFLTLLSTLNMYFFYLAYDVDSIHKSKLYSSIGIILFAIAALTKGVAGLFIAPGIFLIFIFSQKRILLLSKTIWLSAFISIFFVLSYYISREYLNPGYVSAVISNEITGRYMEVNEGHGAENNYYLLLLSGNQFGIWIYFAISGIIITLFSSDYLMKFSKFGIIILLTFLCIISFSQTKLYWYIMPVLPLLAIFAAITFCILLNKINESGTYLQQFIKKSILIFSIFSWPFYTTYDQVNNPKENWWDQQEYNITYYLREKVRNHSFAPKTKIVGYWNNPQDAQHIMFYKNMAIVNGFEVELIKPEKITESCHVITDQDSARKYLHKNFRIKDSLKYDNVTEYEVVNLL